MDRSDLERESRISVDERSSDVRDAAVRDDLVIDLRDSVVGGGAVLDLRGLDAPAADRVLEVAPLADPNRLPLVGSRWVLLVALALLNALDLVTTRAVLAAGGREGNPVMAGLMDNPLAPVLVKMVGIAIVVVVVNSCPPDSRLVNRALSLSVLLYAAIVSWNLVNLLLA